MKYGVQLGGGASVSQRDSLKKVAAAAEELGFDSVLIGDHIVIPKKINAPWPYDEYVGGQTPYAVYTEMEWLDPFDTMAFLAAITERIRLGISVVIVPYRHPFDVARRVATVDVLSGGRFIMGIGVGWLEEEFRLLNIPFKERGARTREYIAVMQALWTQDAPRFSGKFVELNEDVNVLPRPLQKPHPPIWVGGESKPAMRRVASFGNGWHCGLVLPKRIPGLLDQIKGLMEEAGRDFDELEITALAVSNRAGDREIGEYRAAGVDVLYMLPLSNDTNAVIEEMHSFADRVKAAAYSEKSLEDNDYGKTGGHNPLPRGEKASSSILRRRALWRPRPRHPDHTIPRNQLREFFLAPILCSSWSGRNDQIAHIRRTIVHTNVYAGLEFQAELFEHCARLFHHPRTIVQTFIPIRGKTQ